MPPAPLVTALVLFGGVVGGLLAWLIAMHAWFALYHRHKRNRLESRPFSRHALTYASEVWACLTVASFYVTGWLQRGVQIPGTVRGCPVLCVHGFTQNQTNFSRLRRRLAAHGLPSLAVSLGTPFRPLETYVPALRAGLEKLSGFEQVDVVAHSMGGVVLRLTLHLHPQLRQRIRRVITLGSPHQGTAASRWLKLTPDAAQLRRRSPLITALPDFQELVPHARITTIAADRDWIVYPTETAHLEGADQITLQGVGHVGLITRRSSLDHVVGALAA